MTDSIIHSWTMRNVNDNRQYTQKKQKQKFHHILKVPLCLQNALQLHTNLKTNCCTMHMTQQACISHNNTQTNLQIAHQNYNHHSTLLILSISCHILQFMLPIYNYNYHHHYHIYILLP